MIKKIIGMLIAVSMLISSSVVFAKNDDIFYPQPEMNWSLSGIKVAVDGVNIDFPDTKPVLDSNTSRTYVPVRFLAEQLGAEVYWDDEHQVVVIRNKYIEGSNTNLIHYLKIGSNKYVVANYKQPLATNDIKQYLNKEAWQVVVYYLPDDIMPVLKDGRTMLPFRYVAELMGAQVYYREDTGTAHCVKRDMSQYGAGDMGYPVMSTLLSEQVVNVMNKFKKTNYTGEVATNDRPVTYSGTYSDMMVWAGFDQQIHPGQYEYFKYHFSEVGPMHMFSWDMNKDPNVLDAKEFHPGAWYQYAHTYFEGTKYTELDQYGQNNYYKLYRENAARDAAVIVMIRELNTSRWDKAKIVYEELTKKWGLNVEKDKNITYDNYTWEEIKGPENGEYRNVLLADEWVYKNLVENALAAYSVSDTHKHALMNGNIVGFAWVGNYMYWCSLNH